VKYLKVIANAYIVGAENMKRRGLEGEEIVTPALKIK